VNPDIDVSSDGKIWFHLFGPNCLAHLKLFESGN
jgi:hypothetical protein